MVVDLRAGMGTGRSIKIYPGTHSAEFENSLLKRLIQIPARHTLPPERDESSHDRS